MTHTICAIGGDGIGPEVVAETLRVLEYVEVPITITRADAGYDTFRTTGASLPDATRKAARRAEAVLFGAVTTPPHIPGYLSPIVALRKELDLFANVRPFKSLPNGRFGTIDILLFRENTEDLYAGREKRMAEHAETVRVITRQASERIVRYAFEQARQNGRRHVTIVHKANVMRATDGLFLETAEQVAEEFPDIEHTRMLVDACAMQLVLNPQRFDVIVTTNMFGDILSDELAGLTGGLGVAASANIGRRHALFEPVHGSAPKYAGTDTANPLACFRSACLMLRHLGETMAAGRLEKAIEHTIQTGAVTRDIGGSLGTRAYTDAVISALKLS